MRPKKNRWSIFNWLGATRPAQNLRGVLMTAGSLALARAVTAIVQLALVPMLLKYLGVEVFGVWVAICALTVILQVADFGLSNSMVNEVAKFTHLDKRNELLKFLAGRYRLLFCITLASALFGVCLSSLSVWRDVLNISSLVSDESLKSALIAVVLMAALQVVVNANQQVWLGLQKGVFNGFFLAFGAILNLGAIAFCIKINAGLPWVVVASMVGSVVAQVIGTSVLFKKLELRLASVFLGPFNVLDAFEIIKSSRAFFVIQICGLLSYNLDVLLISKYVGGGGVTEYSVVMRLFSIPTLVLSLLLSGLWPVIARAQNAGDFVWIKKNFFRTLGLSITLSVVAASGLYLSANFFIALWTSGAVKANEGLLLGFAFWVVLTAIGGNLATYMNGIGEISYQAKMSVFFAFFNIVTSLVLVRVIGVSGPIWGSVFVTSIYFIFAFRRINKVMNFAIQNQGGLSVGFMR